MLYYGVTMQGYLRWQAIARVSARKGIFMNNPIVFIHGSGDNSRVWRLQVEAVNEQSPYKVYAIDLPGHGQRSDIFATEAEV